MTRAANGLARLPAARRLARQQPVACLVPLLLFATALELATASIATAPTGPTAPTSTPLHRLHLPLTAESTSCSAERHSENDSTQFISHIAASEKSSRGPSAEPHEPFIVGILAEPQNLLVLVLALWALIATSYILCTDERQRWCRSEHQRRSRSRRQSRSERKRWCRSERQHRCRSECQRRCRSERQRQCRSRRQSQLHSRNERQRQCRSERQRRCGSERRRWCRSRSERQRW
jgi:hypothetical protein